MSKMETPPGETGIWGTYEVPQGELLKLTIENLRVFCTCDGQELRLASTYADPDAKEDEINPDELAWQRWAYKQDKPRIEVKPVFPDRPVVVNPEAAFRVAEDASVRVFVRVPIWVRIDLLGTPVTRLADVPVVTLSNTWFGSFQEGELCYWISSGARRAIEVDPKRDYLAICPLLLVDRSPEDLFVEKIRLPVDNLSLFIHEGQLWADEIKIIFTGKTEVSQLEISGKPPQDAKKARLISPPREKPKKSISMKTFSTFKELPGVGLFVR